MTRQILAGLALAALPRPALAASMFGPDNTPLWAGMAVFIVIAALSPPLLAIIASRSARQNRAEDIARQAEVARLLKETNENAERNAKIAGGKLDTIVTMVDGTMTQAIQNDHKSSVALLVALELAERNQEPDAERAAQIEVLKARIPELEKQITDRLRQVSLAEQMVRKK